MPPTLWDDTSYDAVLLCVDRLSGWLVACPTTKLGLTAEKAAHLMLEKHWDPFGPPAIVHSDMGPQFVGQWWLTMCSRLGITTTNSPPHRPRSNGRAERAGQQLLSVLKKLHTEQAINWVEALPRALKLHHDVAGEGGLSPYFIMFGRYRTCPGVFYTPERVCEDSNSFFDRMAHIDTAISQELTTLHLATSTSTKPSRTPLNRGDLVWLQKPSSLASQSKLESRWHGPLQVHSRTGQNTYQLVDKRGHLLTAHIDQLKPYLTTGESEELVGLPEVLDIPQ